MISAATSAAVAGAGRDATTPAMMACRSSSVRTAGPAAWLASALIPGDARLVDPAFLGGALHNGAHDGGEGGMGGVVQRVDSDHSGVSLDEGAQVFERAAVRVRVAAGLRTDGQPGPVLPDRRDYSRVGGPAGSPVPRIGGPVRPDRVRSVGGVPQRMARTGQVVAVLAARRVDDRGAAE